MSYWLVASLGYALAVGSIGITTKISVRHVGWPVIFLATTVAYAVVTLVIALNGRITVPSKAGSWVVFVVLTGLLTAGAFPLLLSALERAPASQVIPITASYPLVTAVLAALFLSEPISRFRALGIILIAGGAVLVSR